MKNPSKPTTGKILNHGSATGVAGAGDLERRAEEVARIDGHERVSKLDRRQAERELAGEEMPALTDEDEESRGALSRDPSEPTSDFGHQVPDRETEEEQFAAERLVAEGVDEAERDQRLAARRRKQP
jgi:hypothetical protein